MLMLAWFCSPGWNWALVRGWHEACRLKSFSREALRCPTGPRRRWTGVKLGLNWITCRFSLTDAAENIRVVLLKLSAHQHGDGRRRQRHPHLQTWVHLKSSSFFPHGNIWDGEASATVSLWDADQWIPGVLSLHFRCSRGEVWLGLD